ncbi:hypothetical protein PHJA_002882400, partial [Phtheirospermum japonicum]
QPVRSFTTRASPSANLIGISSILELSRRSTRGRISEPVRSQEELQDENMVLIAMFETKHRRREHERQRPVPRATFLKPRDEPPPARTGPTIFLMLSTRTRCLSEGMSRLPQSSGERSLSRDLLARENDDDGPTLLLSCLCGNLTR